MDILLHFFIFVPWWNGTQIFAVSENAFQNKWYLFVYIFFHNLLCQYEEKYCSVGKYYIAREFEETSIFRNSFRYFLILWINNWKMSIISILIYDWYIYIFNYLNIFNSTTNFNDNFNDNLLVKYLSDLRKNLK